MGALFSPPKVPSIPPPAPLPTIPKDADIEAMENARRAASATKGRESTILTGGLGDVSRAPVKQRTLLGEV